MAAVAGWNGTVSVGGTALPVTRWNVSWKTDALDVTTMQTSGALLSGTPISAFTPGITDIDLSFDAVWDTTIDPIKSSPPALVPGNTVAITLQLISGTVWTFSFVQITEVNMDDEVRGIVKYTCSGKASNLTIGSRLTTSVLP